MSTTATNRPVALVESWPVPLPEAIIELRPTMPKFRGNIIDPQYCPPEGRHAYLEQWATWCREHPKHIPPFLKTQANREALRRFRQGSKDPQDLE